MELHQARPPFVEFKRVAVHDKLRSEELGRRVTKDLDMAFIMQPGSRDQVERVAVDWLDMIRTKAMNAIPGAYPQEWVDAFFKKFKAWQDGQDMPLDGTSVKEWPILSPAQAENLITLKLLTIEDVASMTEDAMRAYGMGGRELKQKAQEWCKGKDAASLENEALKKKLAALEERLAQIEQKSDNSDEPQQVKRGRKPKTEEPMG
jgi:hypothetical protein